MIERTNVRIGNQQFLVQRTDAETMVNGEKVELFSVFLSGRLVTVKCSDRIERFVVNRNGDELWLTKDGNLLPLVIETERDRLLKAASNSAVGETGSTTIRSAMPGLVVKINVENGQKVKRGDPVLILEAMKMENEVRSPSDGTVKEILVQERDSVEKGASLIALE